MLKDITLSHFWILMRMGYNMQTIYDANGKQLSSAPTEGDVYVSCKKSDLNKDNYKSLITTEDDKYTNVYKAGSEKQFKDTADDAIAFFKQGAPVAESIFPKVFACPMCTKHLRATRSGRFRCSECKSILAINDQGVVSLG